MPTSCVRFMTEGCAVASVLGMLEERESAARVRVEGLREEVARLAERGWLLLEASGAFSAGRRPVTVPDAGSSA